LREAINDTSTRGKYIRKGRETQETARVLTGKKEVGDPCPER